MRKIIKKIEDNFKSEPDSLYGKLNENKFNELLHDSIVEPFIVRIKADRYMRKVFISHLFEEMYREEHDGKLPDRYNDADRLIIEPEVPYTK